MTLENGRSKAFQSLQDAVAWMEEQEMPKNDAVMAVAMPDDLKEFIRDSGKMSTQVRALVMKALGVHWKGRKTVLRTPSFADRARAAFREHQGKSKRKVRA
jgi:hypothetical protein